MKTEFKFHIKQGMIIFAVMSTIGMMLLHLKLIYSALNNGGYAVINYNTYNELLAEAYIIVPVLALTSIALCLHVMKKEFKFSCAW